MSDVKVNSRYLSYNKDEVQSILDGVKTLDSTPTAASNNPVKSGGVATAMLDKLEFTENADPASIFADSSSSE